MSRWGRAKVEPAPSEWAEACSHTENRLHQLAPYIGKLKSTIAGALVERFTAPGNVVLDPFCGSGTIPFECALRGRGCLAFDTNPYAVALTRAKLEAPSTLEAGLQLLEKRLGDASVRVAYPEHLIPDWVSKFFHPETLRNALRFADECIERDDQFLLACLLGILHHQRPGFLSYPSSHLIPYLRDRNFPRADFPELYEERCISPRLRAKVRRALRDPAPRSAPRSTLVMRQGISQLRLNRQVDTILTSPPYMNALDYVRDNRLRMWFLDRTITDYSPEPTDKLAQFEALTAAFIANALHHLRPGGRCILVVGETVKRKRMKSHPAENMLDHIKTRFPSVVLEQIIEDSIPDVRRTRRSSAATKKELMLILRRVENGRYFSVGTYGEGTRKTSLASV